MHVHLVAVKVGVVRGRDAQVEAEGREGQDLDLVAHHRHLVQRRLPVEEHQVAVLQVPLNLREVAKGVAITTVRASLPIIGACGGGEGDGGRGLKPHRVAYLEDAVGGVGEVLEVAARPVVADDVLGACLAGRGVRAVLHEPLQLVVVERRYLQGGGQRCTKKLVRLAGRGSTGEKEQSGMSVRVRGGGGG